MPALEITTMIGCPLMCTFCPQDTLRTEYSKEDVKYMTLDTFKRVVDRLPPEYNIDFSGMAEPWVNPECTDMFEYAMQKGRRASIFTTLYNWDEDTVHRMGELLLKYASQIGIFKVHFPDEAGNMKGWKPSPEWEYAYIGMRTIVRNAGIYYEAMTMSDGGTHPAIRHLEGVGVSHSWSIAAHDRASNIDNDNIKEGHKVTISPKHSIPIKCRATDVYDNNVLLPNGDIVVCCMDYGTKHVLGNLLTHTIDEIRQGRAYKELLEENAKARFSTNSLCRTCQDAVPL